MAIKGKGRTKTKQQARAPRRAPVPVKPPFAQRTWVKATAAFIAGIFLMSMCWWVWENLDKDRNAKAAATAKSQQAEAVGAWRSQIEASLANLGQVQGASVPQIATTLQPALDGLTKGTDPGTTSTDVDTLAAQLEDAANKLEKFKLANAITDHGFTFDQTESITAAQAEIVAALRAYHVAAQLTSLALSAPSGHQQDTLVASAQEALQTAQQLLESGWTKYANAAQAAGVPLPLSQGLAPGSGS
jgi:hypothetical protein